LQGKFQPEILRGSLSGGVKQGWGGKTNYISSFMLLYLENGTSYTTKVTINDYWKLHNGLPIGTTVDDLGCP